MKLANSERLGCSVSVPVSLDALLTRLDALSLTPRFTGQRELALSRALRIYLSRSTEFPLAPLAQELDLARLFLCADFYPEDGQLTLIEQLRDIITEHIPDEERQWLDPLKHSYMDLVEVLPSSTGSETVLRSWGDGRTYRVHNAFEETVRVGHTLLTRLINRPDCPEADEAIIAGSALVVSNEDAKRLYDASGEYRREMEFAGSFELGEWREFAKRFGYMLLWVFADLRIASMAEAAAGVRFVSTDGRPYLYALALYTHHAFGTLSNTLSDLTGFRRQVTEGSGEAATDAGQRTWIMEVSEAKGQTRLAARLILSAAELTVECDSPERLNAVKHQLAATYGYTLHFRGDMIEPPQTRVTAEQLAIDEPLAIRISAEDDWARLNTFLETTYLEWADQESPALGGRTPRHVATSKDGCDQVAALIVEMEQEDLGLRRTGRRAFDYNKLRAHVGLDEVASA